MSERELLERAAIAAGYRKSKWVGDCFFVSETTSWEPAEAAWEPWNPMRFDSDCMRLAVKLRILPPYLDVHRELYVRSLKDPAHDAMSLDSFIAATRRAIVQIAAELEREIR